MLDSLITSKTRIKLLIRLFLNPDTQGYLRGMAEEFNESTNAVRMELNRLEDAGMLLSKNVGNKKVYNANTHHPLFPEIHTILRKVTGIDGIIQKVVNRLGDVEHVYLTGQMANGQNSDLIDLILVCEGIDQNYLEELVSKAEKYVNRRVRTFCVPPAELADFKANWSQKLLLIWSADANDKTTN